MISRARHFDLMPKRAASSDAMRRDLALHDRFDPGKPPVLLNGTRALARLMPMRQARDMAAGLNAAGHVPGCRGSPSGAVDTVAML